MGIHNNGTPDQQHVISPWTRQRSPRKYVGSNASGTTVSLSGPLGHGRPKDGSPTRLRTSPGRQCAIALHRLPHWGVPTFDPGLGAHRMDRIQPEHFEKLYSRMLAGGLKPGTAHQVHRTARTAFGEAFKRGYIARNPVTLAKPTRVEDGKSTRSRPMRLSASWPWRCASATGSGSLSPSRLGCGRARRSGRNGRGCRAQQALEIMRGLRRQTWQHGCADPHACGARYHKTKPCPKNCKRHNGLPSAVSPGLHQPCPLVPRPSWWRPGRSRSQIGSRSSRYCSA